MTPEIIYESSPDAEVWRGSEFDDAAREAAEILAYELRLPWKKGIFQFDRQWTPCDGMTVCIARGRSVQLEYKDIAPDLRETLIENTADEVGEASEFLQLPGDLQEQFISWLKETCGDVHCYRVEDIETIDVVWRDGDWHLPEACNE